MPEETDYSSMTPEQLDELLKAEAGAEPVESVPGPTPDDVPKEPEPAVDVPKEPEPENSEPDIDLAALDAEGERIRREKIEAQLQLQMAHSSRLAGELGFLRKKLESIPTSSEPYEPQSQGELDRLSLLEQRLAQSEAKRLDGEVSQAIESAIGALDGPWSTDLAAEIVQVAPKYADQIKAARETSDPDLARQIATAVALSVKAEAGELAWSNRRKSLEEKRAVQVRDLEARKKAAAVSGGGTASVPRPAPKTYDQMTIDELEAEMVKEFGSR